MLQSHTEFGRLPEKPQGDGQRGRNKSSKSRWLALLNGKTEMQSYTVKHIITKEISKKRTNSSEVLYQQEKDTGLRTGNAALGSANPKSSHQDTVLSHRLFILSVGRQQ